MMSQTLFSRLFSALFFNSPAYEPLNKWAEQSVKCSITAEEEARRATAEREQMLSKLSPEDQQRARQYERMALRQGIMEIEHQSQQQWSA